MFKGGLDLKSIKILILFVLLFFLVACSKETNSKEYLGQIYRIALESIMEKDTALDHNKKFIAIDMSNLKNLNTKDKDDILTYFKKKYKVNVMNTTFDELKEKGLYNRDTMVLEGVLLKIEKVDYKFNTDVIFTGSKYRSGTGAIGVESTVHFKDGKWQLKESLVNWIS